MAGNILKIKSTFPDLPVGFYDILLERVKANGLTDNRLTVAVNYVIDNCAYPRPTVGNFIQADKELQSMIPVFKAGAARDEREG
jgi:hypothetical protein